MHVKFFHASELHVSYAEIVFHMGNSSVMHVNFFKHVNTFIIALRGTACEIQTVKTFSKYLKECRLCKKITKLS